VTAHPLPAPAPERTPETDEFWDATAQGRLLLARCDRCDAVVWYPKTYCSECGGLSVSWREAAGTGTVYSFTVAHRGPGAFGDAAPYVIAYVELAEGPRVLTNIVGCEPDQVAIGQRVQVVFSDTGQGSALYRFELSAPAPPPPPPPPPLPPEPA
jgi:uncharacterized protein